MEKVEIIKGQYKGFFYTIENCEQFSAYYIYELTPVMNERHMICSGSSGQSNKYTEQYIENSIDLLIESNNIEFEDCIIVPRKCLQASQVISIINMLENQNAPKPYFIERAVKNG